MVAEPPRPARGTIGRELFGVLCDRIGAQALPEDLPGASFHAVCHADASGTFASTVDTSSLPPDLTPAETTTRAVALSRINALVRDRSDLIAAFDAIFPPGLTFATHDGPNADGTPGCASSGERALGDELAAVLSRMAPAYDDGTVPQATRALGHLMQAIDAHTESQVSLARYGARAGYRPAALALGAIRPVLAYPGLRDFLRATSKVLSPDAEPYAQGASGQHTAVPGTAYPRIVALNTSSSYALRASVADPAPGALKATFDPSLGLARLSRPRTGPEAAAYVLSMEDPAFGAQGGRFLARRDPRGIVQVTPAADGTVPAPFVDADGDGLPDLDDLGRFAQTGGALAPSPFLQPWITGDTAPRDAQGRPQRTDGSLLYGYMDTSRTYAAALLKDARSMVNPDPTAQHETLMDALAGAYVVLGPRDGTPLSSKTYTLDDGSQATVQFDGFHADASPLLDLLYAGGQLLADPNTDAALATTSWLLQNHQPELAQTVSAALSVRALANGHPEAKIPASSTLWDDVLDVVAKVAQVKDSDGSAGLLSDLLSSFADDRTAPLGDILSTLAENGDRYEYNRNDHNGPSMDVSTGVLGGPLSTPVDRTRPAAGFDRSLFFRFLQLVHDTRGVSVCNREGATVKAMFTGIPVLGNVAISIPDNALVEPFWGKSSFHECEVFTMHDMAQFYVQSIAGKAAYVLRDKQLRDGVQINLGVTTLGVSQTATTVKLLQDSCDITGYQPPGTTDPASRTGFWTPLTSTQLLPRPQWINRNLFFPNGFPLTAPKPAQADAFSKALNPDHAGTSVCPTRDVKDPLDPSDPNYTPGGIIHLPDCADGDWLDQRDSSTVFALEAGGFYDAIAPLIEPFVARGQASLLVDLLDALYKHWAGPDGSASECRLSPSTSCTKDGAVTYEPLVAATLREVFPALRGVAKALVAADAPTPWLACGVRDASGHCVGASTTAVKALAAAMAGAVDPAQAAARGLVDRRGGKTGLRNDGTTNPQVTPIYLLTEALTAMDQSWGAYAALHPSDSGRLAQWRRARSQLVDQLLSADGTGSWHFVDAALPVVAPRVIETLRQQLFARCPEWPNTACAWAGQTLTSDLADVVAGPVFAQAVDLGDALRADAPSRAEVEKLATYLLSSASGNDALVSLLATSDDFAQMLGDEADLVALVHAVGAAMIPPAGDKNLIDANLQLLTRLTAPALGADGGEQCGREIDPNQVLTKVIEMAVTPMSSGRTPIEVVFDVIGDVNRGNPDQSSALMPTDYAGIADQVAQVMLDPQRGLEQFYAIVKNATN
ncbi:MAG TPA: hypothetical protein VGI39_20600 [Polyangiaceae bacterium]|jgi:hypothetical protein